MVNYGHNLARMAIAPAGESQGTRGMIFLQSFELGDGSACLKASVNWEGSESLPITTSYARRETDWRQEASRIATS